MSGTWAKALRIFAVALLLALPAVDLAWAQEAAAPEASSSDTTSSDSSSSDSEYYDPAQDTMSDAEAGEEASSEEAASTDESAADEEAANTAAAEEAPAPATRGPRMGAFGVVAAEKETVQSGGALNDWVFNMFAAVAEFAQRPLLIVLYIVTIVGLVAVRTILDGTFKLLGVGLFYIYSLVQTFALFKTNHYVTDFSLAGGPTTVKALWFAALFTGIMVWGVSRVIQSVVMLGMRSGMAGVLAPLDPRKWLDKFRSKEEDLEALESGTAKNPKRQNTAIMFTDIVGYSAQMGKNEAAMVAKLNIHNEIMRNQIVRNRGTVIKTIGDAFMVRFRSAESAVMCALDCQKAIGEYNKGKTPDDQFHIRIGCHMGEVIHTGTDVFGEGVNIAARIEPKCDPDGVTVSDVIANAARNKIPAHFSSIGRHPMKNITNPPELFKVFPIEVQASAAKAPKAGAGAPAGAAGAGPAAAPGGAPGGTFKI